MRRSRRATPLRTRASNARTNRRARLRNRLATRRPTPVSSAPPRPTARTSRSRFAILPPSSAWHAFSKATARARRPQHAQLEHARRARKTPTARISPARLCATAACACNAPAPSLARAGRAWARRSSATASSTLAPRASKLPQVSASPAFPMRNAPPERCACRNNSAVRHRLSVISAFGKKATRPTARPRPACLEQTHTQRRSPMRPASTGLSPTSAHCGRARAPPATNSVRKTARTSRSPMIRSAASRQRKTPSARKQNVGVFRCTTTCLSDDDCPGTSCNVGATPRVCNLQ